MGELKLSAPENLGHFRRELIEAGLLEKIKALSHPSRICTFVAFGTNWLLIGVCMFLTLQVSPLFALLAIPIIGARQRAMSNLIHDASHFNLSANRAWNDRMTNLLAAFPMLESVESYRKSHVKHHRGLGIIGLDPDLESHRRYGYDDHNPPTARAFSTYLKLAFNHTSWRDSGLGSFFDLQPPEKRAVMIWWIAALLMLLFITPTKAVQVIALWWISKLTAFHFIRLFAEFLDHTGLRPGSVLGFTRTVPKGAWPIRAIIHPHSDNYHLVHHLLPQVPHYHLAKAHQILLGSQTYRHGHHCDGYFFGKYSAVQSWMGQGRTQ